MSQIRLCYTIPIQNLLQKSIRERGNQASVIYQQQFNAIPTPKFTFTWHISIIVNINFVHNDYDREDECDIHSRIDSCIENTLGDNDVLQRCFPYHLKKETSTQKNSASIR